MDKEYRYLPMQKQAGAGLWGLIGTGIGAYTYKNSDKAREVMDDVYRFFAKPGDDDPQTLGAYVNQKVEDGKEAIVDAAVGSPEPRASSDRSVSSWLNTINPFSGMTGGIDYVPAKWYKLFAKDLDPIKDKEAYNQAMKNAHLSWKSLAIGLLTAGVIGGYGVLRHATEHAGLTKGDHAGQDMAEQLSTTFTGDITGVSERERRKRKRMLAQQKTASATKRATPDEPTYTTEVPPRISGYGFFQTALPLGAMLLAGGLAWHGLNATYDEAHNDELTEAIEEKRNALKRIVAERARLAKGTQMRDPVRKGLQGFDESEIYTKDASLDKTASGFLSGATQLTGVLFSAIVLASAIGSYHFTKSSDPNNIAYAAYSKALKEYAKNRASVTPLAIEPDEAQAYFDYINNTKEPEKKRTAREQPAIDTDALNKPISISI